MASSGGSVVTTGPVGDGPTAPLTDSSTTEPHVNPEQPMTMCVEPCVGPDGSSHEVSTVAPATTTSGNPVNLDRRGSTSSFSSDALESGWRYEEKCERKASRMAHVVGDAPAAPTLEPETPVPGEMSLEPPNEPEPPLGPSQSFLLEFTKICDHEVLIPKMETLMKLDQAQLDAKIRECQNHPSCPAFVAHIQSLGLPNYSFGSDDDLIQELAAFEQWCEVEKSMSEPVVPPAMPPVPAPEPPVPAPEPPVPAPQLSALKAVLTRATTCDLAVTAPASSSAEKPVVKVEPGSLQSTGQCAAPAASSSVLATAAEWADMF